MSSKGNGGGNQQNKAQPGVSLNLPIGLDDMSDADTMSRVTTAAIAMAAIAPAAYFLLKGVAKFIFQVKEGAASSRGIDRNDPNEIAEAVTGLMQRNPKSCLGIVARLKGLDDDTKKTAVQMLGGGGGN